MQCPLCAFGQVNTPVAYTRTVDYSCTVCGEYSLTNEATFALRGEQEGLLAFKLAAWVSEQTSLGTKIPINQAMVTWMRSQQIPTVAKRAELYLGAVIRMLKGNLTGRFGPDDARVRVASWSYNNVDCHALCKYLTDLGAFEPPAPRDSNILMLAKGYLIYEQMQDRRALSSQAFVAMWFNDALKDAYDAGIARAIINAGYDPMRIDRKEHDGKIDDQIIAEIRRSAFLVADFTEHRGGVYYEAGFAHGLGRRVIFTCRSDHLENLHFDVRQYNTLKWNTPADLVAPLQNRILALFGAGPHKPDAKPV